MPGDERKVGAYNAMIAISWESTAYPVPLKRQDEGFCEVGGWVVADGRKCDAEAAEAYEGDRQQGFVRL